MGCVAPHFAQPQLSPSLQITALFQPVFERVRYMGSGLQVGCRMSGAVLFAVPELVLVTHRW